MPLSPTSLGAQVRYFARMPVAGAAGERRAFDDLLREGDIVSLHLPLTAETKQLIDERRLGLMKRGAIKRRLKRAVEISEAGV